MEICGYFLSIRQWIRQRARHRRVRVTSHFLVADDGEVPHAQVGVLFIGTEL
jgi:hypothetical protein